MMTICISTTCWLQSIATEGITEGFTVMTNHGLVVQSESLHGEALMQVNHILNVLISRSGGGEREKQGEEWEREICSAR